MITGFDAFGKHSTNPSQRIAEQLPEEFKIPRSNLSVEIDTLVLPTCCKQSWRLISKQLAKSDYSSLILVGLAGGRKRISLERFALNIRDYGIKDNSGHQYDGTEIYAGEPDALKTDLPLVEMRNALRKKNFPTEVSNFAGSFICNEVYYQGLRYKEKTGALNSVLFVHVPHAKDLAQTLVDAENKDFLRIKSPAARSAAAQRMMLDCVQEIAAYCSKLSSS
ncbi:MAG: pyroglutamyl-peptidase I [Cyanobacteria bacterium SZAS-4]|nr:pyroglutamyl-peptidase I [Cyanobacteria bacterium SZAS-4]